MSHSFENTATGSLLTHLLCPKTGETYNADTLQNLSRVGAPLLAQYDITKATITPASVKNGPASLWRYAELLPVRDRRHIADLGEGWTPLLASPGLRSVMKMPHLYVKEESVNPTGSFKARGMAVAVARARELGAHELAVGTAGNAGGAMSAYCGALGMKAHVAMPEDTPRAFVAECQALGADLTLVKGLITDANASLQPGIKNHGWFDMATLKEPYRLEGKKTMGYELFEQFDGSLPDVILYPTGGGTGLIGMWKAFDEMEALGWIGSTRPRMISVQAAGCAPIVTAFESGADHAEMFPNAATFASGLRVPRAVGDFLILDAVRKSGGTAIAVTEEEMHESWGEFGAATGLMVAPEGAATLAALKHLLDKGLVSADERVVLFNTGTGLKYIEGWFRA